LELLIFGPPGWVNETTNRPQWGKITTPFAAANVAGGAMKLRAAASNASVIARACLPECAVYEHRVGHRHCQTWYINPSLLAREEAQPALPLPGDRHGSMVV
jgi:hypothetical protein